MSKHENAKHVPPLDPQKETSAFNVNPEAVNAACVWHGQPYNEGAVVIDAAHGVYLKCFHNQWVYDGNYPG